MTAILRGETLERPGGFNLNGATFRRRFSVRTTSVHDGPLSVTTCEGLPRPLERYVDGAGNSADSYVIDIQAVPRESPTEWYADIDYGPVDEEILKGGSNPLNKPIEISGGLVARTKLTTRDIFGNAITNSAGDPYGPQEIDDDTTELEISLNVVGFSLLVPAFYRNALNSDPFLVYPPGTLKMKYVGFRAMKEGGLVYSQVVCHMEYKENWWLELLDEGFYKKVAGVRERITVKDANGARLIYPTEPQLLNGEGDVLDLDSDETPKYRAWHMHPARPFQPIIARSSPVTGFGYGPFGFGSSLGINTPGQREFPGLG